MLNLASEPVERLDHSVDDEPAQFELRVDNLGTSNNYLSPPARFGSRRLLKTNSTNSERNLKREKVVQQEQQKCTSCKKCCKKFATFLFSNIGLSSLVVAYSILGGFIFMELEAPHEIESRRNTAENINNRRHYHVGRLWNKTLEFNIFWEANWTEEAHRIMMDFQNELVNATKKEGWRGAEATDIQWSYAGSLLYAVTVITTIGYGHIAPKTPKGRLVTIIYALFGIPMTLLCLANMGSFLGNCFRLLYKHTCRLIMCMCCPARTSKSSDKIKKPKRKTIRKIHSKEADEWNPLQDNGKVINTGGGELCVIVDDASDARDTTAAHRHKKKERIRVPIFVSLMIIAAYIFGGAFMFSMWEGWNYLEGSYFCFVTLSTIGFGDYVPGSLADPDPKNSNTKLIICCFYLMIGLSLIAMSFNLMQEEVRAKCLWLAIKIGIMEKE